MTFPSRRLLRLAGMIIKYSRGGFSPREIGLLVSELLDIVDVLLSEHEDLTLVSEQLREPEGRD